MDAALGWIGQLVEWLGKLFPRWSIVRTTHRMIKFIGGKKIIVLGPGVHFWWPARTEIEMVPVARQADDLRSQTLVTADDKTTVVGGILIHEIFDVEKFVTLSYDGLATIKDITLTAIHDVVCQMSWEELKAEQRKGTLDTKLKNAAKKALEEYGVRVIKVMLTDLAPARVIKLIQSTSVDG